MLLLRQKSEADTLLEQPVETDKYWVDDKQRTTEVLQADKHWTEGWKGAQQGETHVDRQRLEDRLQERALGETRTTDRQWVENRHMDRQWTVDRHTQRQIDRKIERQWMGGRQIDRSWSQTDTLADPQWTESRLASRKTDRHVPPLHLAQRPLPPYPSDKTPSPKQTTDSLTSTEVEPTDWQQAQQDAQGDRHTDAGGGFTEGWRSSVGGGGGAAATLAVPCASKPDPPPQSSKPNLSRLRQRHRLESAEALPGTTHIHVNVLQARKDIFDFEQFLTLIFSPTVNNSQRLKPVFSI